MGKYRVNFYGIYKARPTIGAPKGIPILAHEFDTAAEAGFFITMQQPETDATYMANIIDPDNEIEATWIKPLNERGFWTDGLR